MRAFDRLHPKRTLFAALLAGLTLAPSAPIAETATKVFLNGRPAPVYFSDGDSFRVLAGEHAGMKTRLAGFNTLESFGPVHRWGDWHAKELYTLSKAATMNARRGVWRCTSDFERDTYQRVLWHCRDLGVDQIRRGLAHAYSADYEPGDPVFLAAQKEAIENKRGIWAHGVPGYVLTSLHSVSEGRSPAYNRLISTRDAHSAKWAHTDDYSECQEVCKEEQQIEDSLVQQLARELLSDSKLAPLGEAKLIQATGDFARLGYFGGVEEDLEGHLKARLQALKGEGRLGELKPVLGSCHVYVDFNSRYGPGRAGCLK